MRHLLLHFSLVFSLLTLTTCHFLLQTLDLYSNRPAVAPCTYLCLTCPRLRLNPILSAITPPYRIILTIYVLFILDSLCYTAHQPTYAPMFVSRLSTSCALSFGLDLSPHFPANVNHLQRNYGMVTNWRTNDRTLRANLQFKSIQPIFCVYPASLPSVRALPHTIHLLLVSLNATMCQRTPNALSERHVQPRRCQNPAHRPRRRPLRRWQQLAPLPRRRPLQKPRRRPLRAISRCANVWQPRRPRRTRPRAARRRPFTRQLLQPRTRPNNLLPNRTHNKSTWYTRRATRQSTTRPTRTTRR